nr:RRXRR domain-containing protein [Okeania sp. KiyG1]
MALLEGNKVIWMLEIQHRGSLISEKLRSSFSQTES